jgi:hypothetical protein
MKRMSDSDRLRGALRYGPPQPTGPPPSIRQEPARRGRVPAAVWPVLALIVAVVVGAGVGIVVTGLGTAGSDDDGFGELGAFLLGLALGVVAFAATYLGGLSVAARRAFPPGRRILPWTLSLAIPAALVAFALALGGLADSQGTDYPRALGIMTFIGAVASAPASFTWAAHPRTRRGLALAAASLVALMVVSTAAEIAVTRHQLDQVADRTPFVLFAGRAVNAPFDGWRRDTFRTITIGEDEEPIASHGSSATLKYFAPRNVVFVTMHTDIGPCEDTSLYTCRATGTLQGNEIRRYERITPYDAYPRSDAFDVLVYPDGSAVSVNDNETRNVPGTRPDVTTSQVLQSLVRVDRQQFEHATGATLRLA